jgi:hypothetical protein
MAAEELSLTGLVTENNLIPKLVESIRLSFSDLFTFSNLVQHFAL